MGPHLSPDDAHARGGPADHVKVKDLDKGYKKLVNRLTDAWSTKHTVKVGIFESEGAADHGGVSVLEVAIWNEFGTENIPSRSFVRAWFDENQAKCQQAITAMMRAAAQGKYTTNQALELLAQRFVGEMQKRIAAGIEPANAPSTVARKGSSKPLINTGQLRSSLTYAVDDKVQDSKATVAAKRKADKGRKKQVKRDAKARQKDRQKKIRAIKKGLKRATRTARRSAIRNAKKVFRSGKLAVRGKKRR